MRCLRDFAAFIVNIFSAHRIEILAVIVAGFFALGAHINDVPLVDWDEATYAEVAHEAVASGHYLDLTWNGAPYLKKPPMLFWLSALSFKTFGESEFSARLPSVLAGIGTLILIYLAAAAAAGRIAAILSALIPLGFYFFIARGGREAATDAPMLFFSTLAIWSALRARPHRGWLVLAGAACGMAILSKGLAGVIPAIVIALAVAALPAYREIGVGGLLAFSASAAVVAGPWCAYEVVHNRAMFWSIFVGQETLARLTSHLEDHRHSANFTLHTFIREIRFLWPVLIPMPVVAWIRLRAGIRSAISAVPPAAACWLIWLGVAMGAACAVQTRLPWYILPALVPFALLAGAVLADAFYQPGRAGRVAAALGVVAIAVLALTARIRWQDNDQTCQVERAGSMASYTMAVRARELAAQRGGRLYFAGIPLPTLIYYSKLKCEFVAPSDRGEFELIGDDLAGPLVADGELMLVGPDRNATIVSNYEDESRIDATAAFAPTDGTSKKISVLPPHPLADTMGD